MPVCQGPVSKVPPLGSLPNSSLLSAAAVFLSLRYRSHSASRLNPQLWGTQCYKHISLDPDPLTHQEERPEDNPYRQAARVRCTPLMTNHVASQDASSHPMPAVNHDTCPVLNKKPAGTFYQQTIQGSTSCTLSLLYLFQR